MLHSFFCYSLLYLPPTPHPKLFIQMDSKTVDYSLFLSTDKKEIQEMTIVHNRFMNKQPVTNQELYQYCVSLCSMSTYLQNNKSLLSPIQPLWYIGGMSCNCYLFEVLMRGNQYMSKIVDTIQSSTDFMDYIYSMTSGPVITNSTVTPEIHERFHPLILLLQQALGIGWFLSTLCIPIWTDIPHGFIEEDLKDTMEYYHYIRAVLLLYATPLVISDKKLACSMAWTSYTLIRSSMVGSVEFRNRLAEESRMCATWLAAKLAYHRGRFDGGAMIFKQQRIPKSDTMPDWAKIMIDTRKLVDTLPSIEEIMKEWNNCQKMKQGISPIQIGLFGVIPPVAQLVVTPAVVVPIKRA
jgi:hypothetical protein